MSDTSKHRAEPTALTVALELFASHDKFWSPELGRHESSPSRPNCGKRYRGRVMYTAWPVWCQLAFGHPEAHHAEHSSGALTWIETDTVA